MAGSEGARQVSRRGRRLSYDFVAEQARGADMKAGQPSSNDAVVDAIPCVYGVPAMASPANRLGLAQIGHCARVYAPANHILPTINLEGSVRREPGGSRRSSGDAKMRVAIEVNVALWGMILCGLQTAQYFY
jgi:hypothetical protein